MGPGRDVQFQTFDGTVLRGNLYLPEAEDAPIIIMVSGLSFLKEHFATIPEIFANAGFAVLTYDHRSWGISEGQPRQKSDLFQQSDDLSDAITFVSRMAPAIDPSKIFLWGGGHGAGVGIPVAVFDSRVTSLIMVNPFISGLWDSEAFPAESLALAWEERINRASAEGDKDAVYIPVFPESVDSAQKNPHSSAIGAPQAVGFHKGCKQMSDAAGTPWDNKIAVQSLYIQRKWEPTVYFPQSTRPILYITARKDEFTAHEHHMEAYEKIKGPKELLVLESENLQTFGDEKYLRQVMDKTISFAKSLL